MIYRDKSACFIMKNRDFSHVMHTPWKVGIKDSWYIETSKILVGGSMYQKNLFSSFWNSKMIFEFFDSEVEYNSLSNFLISINLIQIQPDGIQLNKLEYLEYFIKVRKISSFIKLLKLRYIKNLKRRCSDFILLEIRNYFSN